jgi:hypothetical protein
LIKKEGVFGMTDESPPASANTTRAWRAVGVSPLATERSGDGADLPADLRPPLAERAAFFHRPFA